MEKWNGSFTVARRFGGHDVPAKDVLVVSSRHLFPKLRCKMFCNGNSQKAGQTFSSAACAASGSCHVRSYLLSSCDVCFRAVMPLWPLSESFLSHLGGHHLITPKSVDARPSVAGKEETLGNRRQVESLTILRAVVAFINPWSIPVMVGANVRGSLQLLATILLVQLSRSTQCSQCSSSIMGMRIPSWLLSTEGLAIRYAEKLVALHLGEGIAFPASV